MKPLSLFLILTLGLLSVPAAAQQFARYSMPWRDVVQFNPAYAGLDNSLSITGAYRSQWGGLAGQPTGQRISAHLPIYYLSSGFGVEVELDNIGARQLNNFGASYNYQLVTGSAVWSVGVSARMQQLSVNGGDLRTPEGVYESGSVVIHNDDRLPTGTVDNSALSFGAGVFYQSANVDAGLSARNLNGAVMAFEGFDYVLRREYHAYLRLRMDLLRTWEALPMAYAVSDGTQHQVQLGANFRYRENLFVGAAFRGVTGPTPDAIVLQGGINISDKLNLAYAYDLTLSDLRSVQNGSHEISLNYNLGTRIGAGVPPPVIFYPRTKE